MKTQYLLRLPKNLKQKLDKEATEKGYSLNSLILFILHDYLNKDNKDGEQFTNL